MMVPASKMANTEKAYLFRGGGGGGEVHSGKKMYPVFGMWKRSPWNIQVEMSYWKFWERT